MYRLRDGFPEDFESWSCQTLLDVNNRIQYVGFINPSYYAGQFTGKGGVADLTVEAWAVMKLTYHGTSITIATASWARETNGNITLDNQFDDPGSLTYT